MNRFKKMFDKNKVNLYKTFLKSDPNPNSKVPPPSEEKINLEKPIEVTQEKKKEKKFVETGPQLFVSVLLNKKGPLNAKEIWHEYQKDLKMKEQFDIRSVTYLKQNIIAEMKRNGKIKPGGFSKIKNRFVGFVLDPEKAFQNVHPGILEVLEPRPMIKRFLKSELKGEVVKEKHEENEIKIE